ncbi:MAG: ABC transporter permease [Candidatus Fermentibacteraceae bacterium]|nr:ABC transporter permease [Candidatus Fermentibacteraceae bacterium]
MPQLLEAFRIALDMIISGDPVVFSIAFRTLMISVSATLLAALIFIPVACLIHFSRFRGKRFLTSIIQTLFSVPTVFVGMLVFLLISRAGPLGSLGMLFTPGAIVLGEVLLIAPIITGLMISTLSSMGKDISDTAISLGAGQLQMVLKVLSESRYMVLTTILLGFGRAVSEIGVAIIVGGNISGHTRTLTTAIALGVGKGETSASIALGIILLALAMIVSLTVNTLRHRGKR